MCQPHTALSVSQVAEFLGCYESQSAFATVFRRHTGVTTRVFRLDWYYCI